MGCHNEQLVSNDNQIDLKIVEDTFPFKQLPWGFVPHSDSSIDSEGCSDEKGTDAADKISAGNYDRINVDNKDAVDMQDSAEIDEDNQSEQGKNDEQIIEGENVMNESRESYSCDSADIFEGDFPSSLPNILLLSFDYEVFTSRQTNVTNALVLLEKDMLEDVAGLLGLIDCNQSNGPQSRKRLRRTLQGNSQENYGIKAVTSKPADYEDSDILECTNTEGLGVSEICTPIKGLMAIYADQLLSSSSSAVNYTTSQIANSMKNDKYVSDDIIKVHYIGDRAEEPNEDLVIRTTNDIGVIRTERAGLTTISVSMLTMGAATTILFSLIFYFKKVRNKKVTEPDEIDISLGYDDDLSSNPADVSDESQDYLGSMDEQDTIGDGSSLGWNISVTSSAFISEDENEDA